MPHLATVGDDEPDCLAALQIQWRIERKTHRVEQIDMNGSPAASAAAGPLTMLA